MTRLSSRASKELYFQRTKRSVFRREIKGSPGIIKSASEEADRPVSHSHQSMGMAARRPFRGSALLLISSVLGFSFEQGCSRRPIHARTTRLALTVVSREVVSPSKVAAPSSQWELDFFSRPVQGADGKKLWELLVTDGTGSFRHVEAVPSNCVNSRELRTRVQRVIDASNVKPENIRFFRKQMKNMISIALGDLPEVRCVPSRATYQLSAWLEEREATVYPGMSGYRKPRPEAPGMKMPVRLPEQLRGAPPP